MQHEQERDTIRRRRDLAIIIGLIVLIIGIFGLLGGGMMGWGMFGPRFMGPGMMGRFGFGFSPWWGILMTVFWTLIIVGVVLLAAWFIRQEGSVGTVGGSGRSRPLEILRERYAKGEITREQYEQMRRDLAE